MCAKPGSLFSYSRQRVLSFPFSETRSGSDCACLARFTTKAGYSIQIAANRGLINRENASAALKNLFAKIPASRTEGHWPKPSPYGQSESIILPSEKASAAINIIRAVKATEITARLYLRIRRSYACTQPTSPILTGLRPNAPSNPLPLVFTPRFYQSACRGDERQKLFRKSKFIVGYGNLIKMQGT